MSSVRLIPLALACGVLVALGAPAAEGQTELPKYVTHAGTIPEHPHEGAPTTLVLSGVFPDSCGLALASGIDPNVGVFVHLQTLACRESLQTSWERHIDLGL